MQLIYTNAYQFCINRITLPVILPWTCELMNTQFIDKDLPHSSIMLGRINRACLRKKIHTFLINDRLMKAFIYTWYGFNSQNLDLIIYHYESIICCSTDIL